MPSLPKPEAALHELPVDVMLVSTQTDHSRRELDTWAAFCQALFVSNELRYVD